MLVKYSKILFFIAVSGVSVAGFAWDDPGYPPAGPHCPADSLLKSVTVVEVSDESGMVQCAALVDVYGGRTSSSISLYKQTQRALVYKTRPSFGLCETNIDVAVQYATRVLGHTMRVDGNYRFECIPNLVSKSVP
jgi:hypothetical protein